MAIPNIPLPDTLIVGDTPHADFHNEVNEAVNYIAEGGAGTAGLFLATPAAAPGDADYRAIVASDIAAALVSGRQIRTIFEQTAEVTVANTDTPTSLVSTGVGSVTIPANTLQAGSSIFVQAYGVYSTKAATAGYLQIALLVAGVIQSNQGAITMAPNLVDLLWRASFRLVVRTAGATGTAIVEGVMEAASTASAFQPRQSVALATFTIDTTIANTLDLQAIWQTSDVANTTTIKQLHIELSP